MITGHRYQSQTLMDTSVLNKQLTESLWMVTSLYQHLCYHLIAISSHNIIIISNISFNIIINTIMFNIMADITISLCLLKSHVTMTCVHATNTGWLPPNNATTT